MNLKHSKQRDSIMEFLATRVDHPTADTVYMNVRKTFPNISLGTVYRNLTLLADIGEISRIRLDDGVDHFDPNTSTHHHLICSECGNVVDLPIENLDFLTEMAQKNYSGSIEGYMTYFYGRCPSCTQKVKPKF